MKHLALLLLAVSTSVARAARGAGGRGAAAVRPRRESLVSLALDAVASAESDADLGSDLEALQSANGRSGQRGKPETLEQYCKGGKDQSSVGTQVDADWMGMGEKYPGEISDENKDGTVDIAYNDGFEELNVPLKRVKITEDKIDTKDDPACELKEFTKDLKEKVVKVRKKVGKWIEDKTEDLQEAGVEPEDKSAKADKETKQKKADDASGKGKDPNKLSGNATEAQSEELERLKKQLGEKDTEIQELEQELRETDDAIEEEGGKDSAPMTMDDLIAMYKARIERRDRRIAELKGRLDKRKKKLEEIRDPESDKTKTDRTTVEDISNEVEALSKEIDKARAKRARLVSEGKMDPELDHTLEGLFRMQEQLEDQLRELERLQSRVQERKEAARRAAKKAEADAREAAEKAGDSPEEVERKAQKAREEASKESDAMEAELLQKARAVSEDLDKVQKSAQELDSGVIPHGHKWWRYRYEHAYVEAILMIMVCFLMLFWERVYQWMRWKVRSLSNAEEADMITHGTMYIGWLEFLAGELMTSLFVFLTCWVLAECHAFEVFPVFLQDGKYMHLPKTSLEYRRLALDVCVVFFFAILFYYAITLSVVDACTKKLETWASFEEDIQRRGSVPGDEMEQAAAAAVATSATAPAASATGSESQARGSLGGRTATTTRTMRYQQAALHRFLPRVTLMGKDSMEARNNYKMLKTYFFDKVKQEPAMVQAMLEENIHISKETFPFWIYLRLAVRRNSDKLFQFGLPVWACLIVTFVGLLFLHRFAQMGCVRVMFAVFVVLSGVLLLMVWWINKICKEVMTSGNTDAGVEGTQSDNESGAMSFHQRFNTEEGVIVVVHFLLFFTCYLAARMICQPWMWRLHFWLVLSLTCLLVLLGTFFVCVVAPMIPDFCVALAMPPHVDPTDVRTMNEAIHLAEELDDEALDEAIHRPEMISARKSLSAAKF